MCSPTVKKDYALGLIQWVDDSRCVLNSLFDYVRSIVISFVISLKRLCYSSDQREEK